jgi:hypothetical protein
VRPAGVTGAAVQTSAIADGSDREPHRRSRRSEVVRSDSDLRVDRE